MLGLSAGEWRQQANYFSEVERPWTQRKSPKNKLRLVGPRFHGRQLPLHTVTADYHKKLIQVGPAAQKNWVSLSAHILRYPTIMGD